MLKALSLSVVACALVATPVLAGGTEDFEHGNVSLYTLATPGANLTTSLAAAHDGVLGLHAGPGRAGFHVRGDVPTAPGSVTWAYVRANSQNSRFQIGVAAGAGGAYSAVLAFDVNKILLEDNTGFGTTELASRSYNLSVGVWYRLELHWSGDGNMRASLRDEAGLGSLILETTLVATGVTTPGGLALRGFGDVDCDTVASTALCAAVIAEGFESGSSSGYSTSGPNASTAISASAAHDGAFGVRFGSPTNPFLYRTDVATFPGSIVRAFVRSQALSGRVSLGVSASLGGAVSAVMDFDVAQLRVEDNTGFGALSLGSVALSVTANTWYQLELSWSAHGDMTASVYDESGATLITSTGNVIVGATAPGGLAFQGHSANRFNHLDSVSIGDLREDFEHGDTNRYVFAGGGSGKFFFTPAAAHDGALGIEFYDGFGLTQFRTDVRTFAGTRTSAFVRLGAGPGTKRVGLGVKGNGGTAFLGVLDAKFNTLRLEYRVYLGTVSLMSETPFTPSAGVWYRLEVAWASNGDVGVSLLDEAGTSVLATTWLVANNGTFSGNLSLLGQGVGTQMDTIAISDCQVPRGEVTYCTAKLNSLGCAPFITFQGTPKAYASITDPFQVRCRNVRNQKAGVLLYSVNTPPASAPFQCGTLCLTPPIRRTPGTYSGGSQLPADDCSGLFYVDMNAFAQGAGGGNPAPELQVPGTSVNCQWWGRDPGNPAPCSTMLSDALHYEVRP